MILAGVMLKMGTYGLVRFAFPLFPQAAAFFAPYLAGLAVIGIIYGALVAMVQPDMKKLVAYSSVSHLGFVVLGICAMNTQGVQGAVYQMLNHGVSTGGLFLIVGMLSDRRHTRLIAEYGGLKRVTPRLVAAFLIVTLSSIGLPGLNGFVGEFLILLGAFRWDPWLAAFAATGVILSAVYMLWMFQRVNYGPVSNEKNAALAGSPAARVGGHRADRRAGGADGRLSEPVPASDRAIGRAAGEQVPSKRAGADPGAEPSPQPSALAPPARHAAMMSSFNAIVPMACVTAAGHCRDGRRGLPRSRRAHADRRPRRGRACRGGDRDVAAVGSQRGQLRRRRPPTTSGCS